MTGPRLRRETDSYIQGSNGGAAELRFGFCTGDNASISPLENFSRRGINVLHQLHYWNFTAATALASLRLSALVFVCAE